MRDGSTLPDTKENAIIKDGVYSAVYWIHNGSYAALQLRVSEVVDKIDSKDLKAMM